MKPINHADRQRDRPRQFCQGGEQLRQIDRFHYFSCIFQVRGTLLSLNLPAPRCEGPMGPVHRACLNRRFALDEANFIRAVYTQQIRKCQEQKQKLLA